MTVAVLLVVVGDDCGGMTMALVLVVSMVVTGHSAGGDRGEEVEVKVNVLVLTASLRVDRKGIALQRRQEYV